MMNNANFKVQLQHAILQQQQRRSSSSSTGNNKPAVPPKPKLTLTDTTSKLFMSSQAFMSNETAFIFSNKPKVAHHSSSMALEATESAKERTTAAAAVEMPKPIASSGKCRSLKIDTCMDMKSSCKMTYNSDEHSTSSSSSSSSSFDKEMDPIVRISERVCSFEDKSIDLFKQVGEKMSALSIKPPAEDRAKTASGITGNLLDEIYAEIEDKQIKSCLASSGSNETSDASCSLSAKSSTSSDKTSVRNADVDSSNKRGANDSIGNQNALNQQAQFCTSPFCSTSSYTSSNSCSCSSASSSYSNAYSATYISNNSTTISSPPPLPSVPPPPLSATGEAKGPTASSTNTMRSRRKQSGSTPKKASSKGQASDFEVDPALDLILPKNTLSLEEEIELEINRNKPNDDKIELFGGRKNENENNAEDKEANYASEENFNDDHNNNDDDDDDDDFDDEDEEEADYLEPIILTQGLNGHQQAYGNGGGGSKKLAAEDTNSVQTVDYNDENLASNYNFKLATTAADSDNQSTKSSSLNQGNPPRRNARIHSINNYAELFSLSPSKLKSYILNQNKSSKSPSTISNSSKMSQQSQATNGHASQSVSKSSLNYILKTSSKLTSTLRLIRTRSLTQANTLNALINSNVNLAQHHQPTVHDISSPINSPSLAKRSNHSTASHATTTTSASAAASAIQISQPTLISQTFDLSKQNLIELKQPAKMASSGAPPSPINYENLNEITPCPAASSLSVNCGTLNRLKKLPATPTADGSLPPTIVSNTIITNVYEEDDLIATHQQTQNNTSLNAHYASSNVASTIGRAKPKSFLSNQKQQVYSAASSYYRPGRCGPVTVNSFYNVPNMYGANGTLRKEPPPKPPPRDDLAAGSVAVKRSSTGNSSTGSTTSATSIYHQPSGAASRVAGHNFIKIIDTSNNNNYNYKTSSQIVVGSQQPYFASNSNSNSSSSSSQDSGCSLGNPASFPKVPSSTASPSTSSINGSNYSSPSLNDSSASSRPLPPPPPALPMFYPSADSQSSGAKSSAPPPPTLLTTTTTTTRVSTSKPVAPQQPPPVPATPPPNLYKAPALPSQPPPAIAGGRAQTSKSRVAPPPPPPPSTVPVVSPCADLEKRFNFQALPNVALPKFDPPADRQYPSRKYNEKVKTNGN